MNVRDRIIKIITMLLIFALGVFLYQLFITPKRRGINTLQQSLKNVDLQISNILGEEVTLRGGVPEEEQLQKFLDELILQIPSEKDIPKIINQFLTKVGKGLKVDYSLVQPKKLQPKGRYKQLPIELKFSCSYSDFNTYLSQLKALPEVFKIDRLDMRRMPGQPEKLSVHMVVSAFVIPGKVEERIEAITKEAYPKAPKVSPFKPKKVKSAPAIPGKEPITETMEEREPIFTLQGIMGGDLKAAIINDHLLYVDDVIDGYRIINIKKSSVILKRGGKIKRLKLEE